MAAISTRARRWRRYILHSAKMDFVVRQIFKCLCLGFLPILSRNLRQQMSGYFGDAIEIVGRAYCRVLDCSLVEYSAKVFQTTVTL